jgi:hypothetical protein
MGVNAPQQGSFVNNTATGAIDNADTLLAPDKRSAWFPQYDLKKNL